MRLDGRLFLCVPNFRTAIWPGIPGTFVEGNIAPGRGDRSWYGGSPAKQKRVVNGGRMSRPFEIFNCRWLSGRTASILFGVASVQTLVVSVFVFYLFSLDSIPIPTSAWVNDFWAFLVASGVLCAVFVWKGMLQFWKKCDRSAKPVKRVAYFFLLLGLWYGAIVYYLLIYLRRRKVDAAFL